MLVAPAHPLRLATDGSLAIVQDESVIRSCLAQIMSTNGSTRNGPAGEVPWAPEFGGSVDHLRFSPLGDLLNEAVAARVVGSAAVWERRARITSVGSQTDLANNTASLTVTYGSPSIGTDQVTVTR
jgi:phage baseplate assembly protein W